MSELDDRRQAARDKLVEQCRKPAFEVNPAFLEETRDPRWKEAAEKGKRPLFKTEKAARKHVNKLANEADKRMEEHRR